MPSGIWLSSITAKLQNFVCDHLMIFYTFKNLRTEKTALKLINEQYCWVDDAKVKQTS